MNSRNLIAGIVAVALVALAAVPAQAGAERVTLPSDYRTTYTLYTKVDRPDRNIVRFMYVNREALTAARPGQPLPYGTVLVMEDHKAKLGSDGTPMRDAEGRFIAEDKVDAVFVQQKGQGWGNDYPADKRNGDWEYARFEPLNPGTAPALVASQKYDGCFACHLSREARDFTFTFTAFVNDTKK